MQFRQQSDMSLKHGWFLLIFVVPGLLHGADARANAVVTISPAELQGWTARSFERETLYRVEDGGRGPALHALAHGSASGLCRYEQIDLGSLPVVRWSWRLDRAPQPRNERSKGGDDQGLRLGFVFAPSPEVLLSIQYVWSQSEPEGASWANAFIPNTYQLAVRSGPAEPGIWKEEQRDLDADFRTVLGGTVDRINAICLMTDGDQTGALVEGWYGDITFQAR